jgi:hypothetical protein
MWENQKAGKDSRTPKPIVPGLPFQGPLSLVNSIPSVDHGQRVLQVGANHPQLFQKLRQALHKERPMDQPDLARGWMGMGLELVLEFQPKPLLRELEGEKPVVMPECWVEAD